MWVASQDLPRSAAHPFYTRRRPFDSKAFMVNAPERATDGVVAGTEEHHEQ
jgi:hypothetical protein